ncbi:hypothetical protein WJR50_01310 [Catalinimonas sp. 4WD22]|uniref:hypothetical protein n=1 Tax=Catalinimonas locisalis TaxID=3133978 RepID=UPI0031014B8C
MSYSVYAQDTPLLAIADSVVTEQIHASIEKKKIPEDKVKDSEVLHFQFDTDKEGQSRILIHLSDSVQLLTISAYNLMGESKEAVREQALNPGFYEFALPKNSSESLNYWQVSMEGQKVISFIR